MIDNWRQSTFSILDSQPSLTVFDEGPRWAIVVPLLLASSTLNAIISLLLATLTNVLIIDVVKWAIVAEVGICTGLLIEPTSFVLVNYIAGLHLPNQTKTACCILISNLENLLCASGWSLMSITLLVLANDELDDWETHPWTFSISYMVFITSIYKGIGVLTRFISLFAKHNYGERSIHAKLRVSLHDIIIIFTILRYTKPMIRTDFPQLSLWRSRLIAWCTVRLPSLGTRRLLKILPTLLEVDIPNLAGRCWTSFLESQSQYPEIGWDDFIYTIMGDDINDTILRKNPQLADEKDLIKLMDGCRDRAVSLAAEINEQDGLFRQFDSFLSVVNVVLIAFVVLPWLGFKPNEYLVPLGVSITPTIIALTVVLGQNVSAIISCVIFVVFNHPYDVGDDIIISGTLYTVKKIGLLHSVLQDSQGIRVYVSNSIVADMTIMNFSRSPTLLQRIEISLPANSSPHQVTMMTTKLISELKEILPTQMDLAIISTGTAKEAILLLKLYHQNDSKLSENKQRALFRVWKVLQGNPIISVTSTIVPIQIQ